jgi:hypothetical protein
MMSTKILIDELLQAKHRTKQSPEVYLSVWKAFNDWAINLLRQHKVPHPLNRPFTSQGIHWKNLFVITFETEGLSTAQTTFTPHGHPLQTVVVTLSKRFCASHSLAARRRMKRHDDREESLEAELRATLAKEVPCPASILTPPPQDFLKAQDRKNPDLLNVWAHKADLRRELEDLRRSTQGQWARGISYGEFGANFASWASVR